MRTIAIIPTRMSSTRLPGKPLKEITPDRKTMIQVVAENALKCECFSEVWVATPDMEIVWSLLPMSMKSHSKFRIVMTDHSPRNGTERCWQAIQRNAEAYLRDEDLIVNIQGDEPLLSPAIMEGVVNLMTKAGRKVVGTAAQRIANDNPDLIDTDVVKIIPEMESLGHGAKFVRSVENPIKEGGIYKHIGIYSYSKSVLGSAVEYGETQLEKVNRLEQLRFIEMGLGISILLLPELPEIISVDNESDLYRVREILSRSASSRHLTEKYSVDHC